VYVLKAGPVYELLAQNHLGEVQMATAAITGDTILYRTQHHLYALKEVARSQNNASATFSSAMRQNEEVLVLILAPGSWLLLHDSF
jgi:hypothetical protein